MLFVDAQNLYYRCKDHFGWPWLNPLELGKALVAQEEKRLGSGNTALTQVRYYTGIHDPNRNPKLHGEMDRRLQAYERLGVRTFPIPLRYDSTGKAREKGVDVRIGLDLVRLGYKGLYDVAVVASEDSDLDPAVQDVYALRDDERWIAVENCLPWSPKSHTRWLPSAQRKRLINQQLFRQIEDRKTY